MSITANCAFFVRDVIDGKEVYKVMIPFEEETPEFNSFFEAQRFAFDKCYTSNKKFNMILPFSNISRNPSVALFWVLKKPAVN